MVFSYSKTNNSKVKEFISAIPEKKYVNLKQLVSFPEKLKTAKFDFLDNNSLRKKRNWRTLIFFKLKQQVVVYIYPRNENSNLLRML